MGKYNIKKKYNRYAKRHKVDKQRRKVKKILKKLESDFIILFVWILIILMLYEIIEYILFSNRELC